MSDTVHHNSFGLQIEKKCKVNYTDSLLCHSQPMYIGQPKIKIQPVAVTVNWFNKNNCRSDTKHSITPLTHLNCIATKSDDSFNSTSCNDNSISNSKGLPNPEQLDYVFNKLGETLPTLFKQTLNYSLFHPKLVFENNIRGTKSVGLEYLIITVSMLRLLGHIKYAFVKLDILKITKHPEDGTIKVRWRIKGITGLKVFMKFWKFRLWNMDQVIKENVESWHDGFSIFYLGPDGLIYKLTADKMQPDNDPVVEDKSSLTTKLALFLGLSPQLDNLDCLMIFNAKQTNEFFNMVIKSLEDVVS